MPATLQSPYTRLPGKQYRWVKGNLHAHTTRSDGTREPQKVLDLYAALGHDFLAFTDHDVWSDYSGLDAKGLILLVGCEVTAYGPHILQVGSSRRTEPHEDRQKVVDDIVATGGLCVLNHANWEADFDHFPLELMQKLKGYHGMEIYNGVCIDLEGDGYALDKWDQLLSIGRTCWGYSHDDSHRDNHEGRGWNVVQVPADDVTPASIVAALKSGNFYASTGVTIDSIEVDGCTLKIKAANAQAIEIYADWGRRVAVSKGSEISYDASKLEGTYIRAQLYGEGTSMAWTQPFVIRGGVAERRRELEQTFSQPDSPKPTLKALRVESLPAPGSEEMEKLWKKAAESSTFYSHRDGSAPPVKTAIRSIVSSDKLAIRVDCEEPEPAKMKVKTTADGNGSLWAEDSLEIFMDVEGQRQRYYHMMVNPAGAFYATDPLGWSKNLKREVRASQGAGGWTVELVVDLSALAPGLPHGPGTKFPLHLCRNRYPVYGVYFWSWVGTSNHTPSRFGVLEL